MLQEFAINKIILVTHACHMPCAVHQFSKAGFEVLPAPIAFIDQGSGLIRFDFLSSPTALLWECYGIASGIELTLIFKRLVDCNLVAKGFL